MANREKMLRGSATGEAYRGLHGSRLESAGAAGGVGPDARRRDRGSVHGGAGGVARCVGDPDRLHTYTYFGRSRTGQFYARKVAWRIDRWLFLRLRRTSAVTGLDGPFSAARDHRRPVGSVTRGAVDLLPRWRDPILIGSRPTTARRRDLEVRRTYRHEIGKPTRKRGCRLPFGLRHERAGRTCGADGRRRS
jgi:hypothetical protein